MDPKARTGSATAKRFVMGNEMVLSPQLITGAEVLYVCFEVEDQEALKSLAPEGFEPANPGTAFLNQYWVPREDLHSNAGFPGSWGPYTLTYMGVELAGHDLYEGMPCRWWTHYYNSSKTMADYAKAHGLPSMAGGRTELEISEKDVVATTYLDDKPVIRTHATYSPRVSPPVPGQLLYLTRRDGSLELGRYPFVGGVKEDIEVKSIEFLDPDSPFYNLRPKQPLNVTFAVFFPDLAFCYPGGQQKFGEAPF
jgi:hypothetical protein